MNVTLGQIWTHSSNDNFAGEYCNMGIAFKYENVYKQTCWKLKLQIA